MKTAWVTEVTSDITSKAIAAAVWAITCYATFAVINEANRNFADVFFYFVCDVISAYLAYESFLCKWQIK